MIIDVNTFVGAYPFRRVPHTSLEHLLASMDRVSIDHAWVSHLPSLFWQDPMRGNAWLLDACEDVPRLGPVPAIHPGLPHWERELDRVAREPVPAVRCDPTRYGLDVTGPEMGALIDACAVRGLPLVVAVRLEDARQRHPHDVTADVPAAAIRNWVRRDPRIRLVITHAEVARIEEVHFGSTPEEAARLWWDISWIWGPPEDHLDRVLTTIGAERFVFGTGQPLRLPETSVAKLDLAALSADHRRRIEAGNVESGLGRIP